MIEIPPLTIEQEFSIATTKSDCEKLNKEELIELFIDLLRILMTKENIIKSMIREKLGIETQGKKD